MLLLVVPLPRRGQLKPRDGANASRPRTLLVDPVLSVIRHMYPLMMGAYRTLQSFHGDQPSVDGTFGTMHPAQLTAFPTDGRLREFTVRGVEPAGRREKIEQVEHDPCGRTSTGQPRTPFTAGVAGPYGDEVSGGNADRPPVTEAVAGTRLPSDLSDRGDEVPVELFGTVHVG